MPRDLLSRFRVLREPIRIVVIGAGSAGTGLVYQSSITPGIRCVAVCDLRLERAAGAAELVGRPYRVVETPGALHDAVAEGLLAVCEDGRLVAQCDSIDVMIEASSDVAAGGRHALDALERGKHAVMMNAEADLMFGPHLMAVAQGHGAVYTSCDGDQPGVIGRLIDEVRLWGFDLGMAGNIKGYLDRYADPVSIAPEADRRGLDHQMCASYTDGTKLCVEMALVANAFGLDADVPGMRGPRAQRILDVPRLFDLERIRSEHPNGVVDYVIGPEPKGGVFVVGYSASAYQRKMLGWFPARLGEGPFNVFRRPYHLIHIEAMACIAEAFLDGEALLQPTCGLRTNVFCYAKRPLAPGEILDGAGGFCCYGLIENAFDPALPSGVPICLAQRARVRRGVGKDGRLRWSDVEFPAGRADLELYALALRASGAPAP